MTLPKDIITANSGISLALQLAGEVFVTCVKLSTLGTACALKLIFVQKRKRKFTNFLQK